MCFNFVTIRAPTYLTLLILSIMVPGASRACTVATQLHLLTIRCYL